MSEKRSLTGLLAEFTAQAKLTDVPSAVAERARLHLLDTLGVTLAGSLEPQARIPARALFAADGPGRCSLIGSRERLSPGNAALVNGAAAHVHDYDDWQLPWYGHPSAVFLPALFALGEARRCSGARVLTAYAVSMVAGHALACALQPAHQERGWHSTGTIGAIAAAAGCANLLGLDAPRARNAIALGATQAAGTHQNFGTMAKSLHAGLAARTGILSAVLAEDGFDAGQEILDGRMGFAQVYSRGDAFDANAFERVFDDPYRAAFAGLSVKPYPSCGATGPPIDAMLALVENNAIDPADVERIEGVISPLANLLLQYASPTSGLQGKFSFEYCMAVALLDRQVSLAQFTDERAADPRVTGLVARASKETDAAVDPQGNFSSRVTLRLRDGRVVTEYVTQALGTPEKPLDATQIVAKFRECATGRIRDEQIETVASLMRRLEGVDDIGSITGAIREGLVDLVPAG